MPRDVRVVAAVARCAPVTKRHIDYLEYARSLGDKLVVLLTPLEGDGAEPQSALRGAVVPRAPCGGAGRRRDAGGAGVRVGPARAPWSAAAHPALCQAAMVPTYGS